jgi:hypothetical protein
MNPYIDALWCPSAACSIDIRVHLFKRSQLDLSKL